MDRRLTRPAGGWPAGRMEQLSAEYTGPAVVTMCGRDVPATAELQAWRSEPRVVTERGEVMLALDSEVTHADWAGTLVVEPAPDAPPIELPTDGTLTLQLGDHQARAVMKSIEWTAEGVLVLAIIGTGRAPF